MFAFRNSRSLASLLFLLMVWSGAPAQTTQDPKTRDDVVRVYTELVQTDVMVFDKQGRFARAHHTLIWDNDAVLADLKRLARE